MKRRSFHKTLITMGLGAQAGLAAGGGAAHAAEDRCLEPARALPVRRYDVVVAGGGTGGVVAALAAARMGAKTALIEAKGYTGGTVTEGGTALHSFFNLWKAFPGVEKRQVVRGIPQEIVDRMLARGACSGHAEMDRGYDYDSVCTAIDTEMYKLVTMEMLHEAGVHLYLSTLVAGAVREGDRVVGAIAESRSGREAFYAKAFVDCTAYGDLCHHAGAAYTEPNDYAVCNSIGLANVDVRRVYDYLASNDAVVQSAWGTYEGKPDQLVRIQGRTTKLAPEFHEGAQQIGMAMVTTTVREDYFMFIKINMKLDKSPTDRDTVSAAELLLRQRQAQAVDLFRAYVPGCEKAFIARTAPCLNIRRGRLVECDYDVTREDVIEARHFDDEVFNYGFHDSAPRLQVKNGGTYGLPYRALCVKGIENLYANGMMITSNHDAHMSTRNTVSCMAMGQATGTAAALCAKKGVGSRDLKYAELRDALVRHGVYFEG